MMKCPVESIETTDNMSRLTEKEVDFSEYEWMGEELEDFDRQVEEELWEEVFIDCCSGNMLEEEMKNWEYPVMQIDGADLATILEALQLNEWLEQVPAKSNLNPNAPEFIPRSQQGQTSQQTCNNVTEDYEQR